MTVNWSQLDAKACFLKKPAFTVHNFICHLLYIYPSSLS